MISTTAPLTDVLRILGDPTRLRILGLLELGELSVGELARSLGLAQSRVSNHLKVLRDAQLLVERHVGRTTYLRPAIAHDASGPSPDDDLQRRLWRTLRAEIPTLPEFAADVARLESIRVEHRARSRDFFDRIAGEWDKLGTDFETGQARQRAAAAIAPYGLEVADLGCGTGYLSRALLALCRRVVCIDRSPAMLEEARKRLEPLPPGVAIELRTGELDRLPLADRELDACVAGMVLHHLEDPGAALAQMRRVLKPGGRAVIVELAPHREEWMHEIHGDRHLGLDPRDLLAALTRAGFVDLRLESLADRYRPRRSDADDESARPALDLFLVRGRVPTGD
ncbi:MAG: ArsR/SmtB family transcription factor [Planctomycetota bacterium]